MEHAQKTNMLSLSEFAEKLGARLVGDGSKPISGINTIRDADEHQVCFLTSSKHLKELQQTKAAAVIVAEAVEACPTAQVVVDDANRGLITAQEIFAPKLKKWEGIHPTAVIDPDAVIDPTAAVGPHATIAAGVQIGAHSIIGAGCSIGENTCIGSHTRLDSNVVVYHNCRIGDACIIQANSTIGATGFGYSYIDGQHRLIPHNGGVIIEDGVEIGANSCVDRAKFGNTVVGAGTKIDNLVMIAHNVQIGKLCLLAGQVGIAGSTKIGNGVVLAGQSGVTDNVTIGDGVVITAKSVAMSDIPAGQTVMGRRAQPINDELRCAGIYQRLPELSKQVKELAKKVEKLDAAKDD
jgi:UDP-3-O-[3-hydroxymyristoyl] glucosamine N-acyltransferase